MTMKNFLDAFPREVDDWTRKTRFDASLFIDLLLFLDALFFFDATLFFTLLGQYLNY